MKQIIWIIIAVAVIGGLAWWGTTYQSAAPVVETGPVKIGVILPLTGDAAVYGEPARNILEIAKDEINASGGISKTFDQSTETFDEATGTFDGRPIELIFEDGKCAGQDAANAAQKLINVDKVQVIIGGICSGETLAAVPIAETEKVAIFSPSASSPELTGVSPYFARNYPSDSAQGAILANIAYTDKGWKNVIVIQEQTDYALGVQTAFSDTFKALGGTVSVEQFPTEVTDFRSVVSKVKAAKPDAVLVSTQTPAVAARIFTQMNQLSYKPKLMVSDTVSGDPATVTANKAILEGTLAAEFGVDKSNKKFTDMIAAYKAKHGEEPPYQGYAQTEYDSLYLVRDAIAAVGYDGTKVAAWLRTVKDWDGAAGKVTIGENGDPMAGHRPEVIMGGEVKPYVK